MARRLQRQVAEVAEVEAVVLLLRLRLLQRLLLLLEAVVVAVDEAAVAALLLPVVAARPRLAVLKHPHNSPTTSRAGRSPCRWASK